MLGSMTLKGSYEFVFILIFWYAMEQRGVHLFEWSHLGNFLYDEVYAESSANLILSTSHAH